jgi:uncharacterized protein
MSSQLAPLVSNVLARRGARLAAAFRCGGIEPLEVYPYATLRLLGLPTKGKRTKPGRRIIHDALQPLVPGLAHPDASEHRLDAVVCAYTAHLRRQGRTRTVGVADEGLMVIPDTPLSETSATSAVARGNWRAKRPAGSHPCNPSDCG